jgi:hypothetical protein
MKRALAPFLAAIVISALNASPVKAEFIEWRYNWKTIPHVVWADDPEDGHIRIDPSGPHRVTGTSEIIAATLKAFSDGVGKDLGYFTNKAYSLTVRIWDQASHIWGDATFTGVLNGYLGAHNSNIHNTWTSNQTELLHLGSHLYTIRIGPFIGPGAPGTGSLGAIAADVKVTHNPEPSSLVLAGLALPMVGLLVWSRRRVI